MKTLYRELLKEVKRVNPSAAAKLRPGLPHEAVKRKLASLPFEVTPDAASLYEWADGADGEVDLLPGAYFIPLEQALTEFEELYDLEQGTAEEDDPHRRDSFRFLSDWSDGGYAFGRMDLPNNGRIISLCIHAPALPAFADLEHLVKTAIECYRQGIMRGRSGRTDFRRFYRLARRLNPGFDDAWKVAE